MEIQNKIASQCLRGMFVDIQRMPLFANVPYLLDTNFLNADFINCLIPRGFQHKTVRILNRLLIPHHDLSCIEPLNEDRCLVNKEESVSRGEPVCEFNNVNIYCPKFTFERSKCDVSLRFVQRCQSVEVSDSPTKLLAPFEWRYEETATQKFVRDMFPTWGILNDFRLEGISNDEICISYRLDCIVSI